jgi:hypothetical protein
MVHESTTKLESYDSRRPRLVFDIAPSKRYYSDFYDISLKNAGGSPAYNITCIFNPDLPYADDSTLSNLSIFKSLDHLVQGDEITFYFGNSLKFLNDDSFRKETIVTMNYEDAQGKSLSDKSRVNLEKYRGIVFVQTKSIDNIVSELNKLERTISWIRRNGLVVRRPADMNNERTTTQEIDIDFISSTLGHIGQMMLDNIHSHNIENCSNVYVFLVSQLIITSTPCIGGLNLPVNLVLK